MLEVTSKVMVKMALIGVNRQVLSVAMSNERPADTPLLLSVRSVSALRHDQQIRHCCITWAHRPECGLAGEFAGL